MEKFLLNTFVSLTLLLSLSCGKTEIISDQPTIDEATTFGSVQQKTDGEFYGTGGIRFLKNLSSSQMSIGMELIAYLEDPNSSIELVMFAKNPNLSDGVHLVLARSNTQLVGSLDVNNTGSKTILANRLASFGLMPVKLAVDIHGMGNSVQVMIYEPESAIGAAYHFSSQRAGDLTNGALASSPLSEGIHGGILMTNARIQKALRRESVTPRASLIP